MTSPPNTEEYHSPPASSAAFTVGKKSPSPALGKEKINKGTGLVDSAGRSHLAVHEHACGLCHHAEGEESLRSSLLHFTGARTYKQVPTTS